MAITIGDAILWLRARDDKYNSDLDRAESKARSWAGNVGGFLGNAFSTALGFLGAQAFNTIASGIGGIASGMIDGNAQFETYNTQFSVLLGSAEAAEDRLKALAEFGAKTPFELPQVVEADKILQGFGLHSEESAKRFGFSGEQIRRIAGDVASGSGAQFQDMTRYLGQFASGQTGMVLSRFEELGIVTREQLKALGVEFSKSGEMVSPLPEAMNVLLGVMDEKYGGMMDKQSATFEGMKSNLMDWIGATGRALGQPIFDAAKEQLGGLLKFLGSPEVQAGVAATAGALGAITGAVVGFLSALATGEDPIGAVANLVFGLAGAFGVSRETATELFNSVLTLREPFDALTGAFGNIVAFIFGNLIPAIQGIAVESGVQLPTATQMFTGFVSVLGTLMTMAAGFINDPLLVVLGAAVAWVVVNWPTIQATITAVITAVQAIIFAVLSAIQAFWSKWGDEILAVVNSLVSQWQLIFTAFSKAFEGDWRGFGETLRVVWDNAVKAIIKIGEGIGKWFREQDWGAIGQDIVRGVANGITAAAQWIADAALAAARAALEAAKGFLGIKSPSRAFALVGRQSMEGLAEGFKAGSDKAAEQARLSVGASLRAANVYSENSQTTINLTANYRNQERRSLADDVRLLDFARGVA